MNNQGNNPYTIVSIFAGILTTLGAILFPMIEKVGGKAQMMLIIGALIFVTVGVIVLGICIYKLFRSESVPPVDTPTTGSSTESTTVSTDEKSTETQT